ncbi:MAG: cytochrome b/b6 domain-containing protein [Caulobacterales bacterium]
MVERQVDSAHADAGVVVRVWDWPTRLAHWLLVLLIPFSWWAQEYDHLPWHRLSGYTIIGILVFRVYWGFVGPSTARFSGFLRGPASALAYVRSLGAKPQVAATDKPPIIGHNPIGGWSVAAMLIALTVQVTLGLFSVDENGLESGPFDKFVSFDVGRALEKAHEITFWILVGLIALHLTAIGFYALRRDNLVGPMLSGRKRVNGLSQPAVFVPWWRALLGIAGAAAFAWLISRAFRL